MKRTGLVLVAFLAVVFVAVLAFAASQTRVLGMKYTGNANDDKNLDIIDAAIGARPTTTSTSSSTSTSTSTSSSTSTSTSSTTTST